MEDIDKLNPITKEDRKLLSDLTSTYDLGTKTIIAIDDYEKLDES